MSDDITTRIPKLATLSQCIITPLARPTTPKPAAIVVYSTSEELNELPLSPLDQAISDCEGMVTFYENARRGALTQEEARFKIETMLASNTLSINERIQCEVDLAFIGDRNFLLLALDCTLHLERERDKMRFLLEERRKLEASHAPHRHEPIEDIRAAAERASIQFPDRNRMPRPRNARRPKEVRQPRALIRFAQ